MLTAACDF